MIEYNTEGLSATASFLNNLHTGKFRELLPGIFIIKGAKNDRGFDQAYAIQNGKKDLLLIDVVEEAYKEAVQYLLNNAYNIKAILITGKAVLNDCYDDLETLSKDSGGAVIYIHPEIAPSNSETSPLTGTDELLSNFGLEALVIPKKEGEVVMHCKRHNGMIFSGDSAVGSAYNSDEFTFTRGRELKQEQAFEVEEFWKGLNREFDYFFPRKGKPAIEVDERTRTTLLTRLAQGEAELE